MIGAEMRASEISWIESRLYFVGTVAGITVLFSVGILTLVKIFVVGVVVVAGIAYFYPDEVRAVAETGINIVRQQFDGCQPRKVT